MLGKVLLIACTSVLATLSVAAEGPIPAWGKSPGVGVYECRAPRPDGSPSVGLQFGIVDASHYTNYDQKGGTYAWNQPTQTITFTSGPMKGLQRVWKDGTFRVIDGGKLTSMDCPYNSAKNPRTYHW